MATKISPRRRTIALVAIVVLAIATGILGTIAFEEWLHADSGYLRHGGITALFLAMILLQARNLSGRA